MENKLTEVIGSLAWPGSDWLLWGHGGHQTIWMIMKSFPLMTAWVAMLTFPLVWRSFLLLLQNMLTTKTQWSCLECPLWHVIVCMGVRGRHHIAWVWPLKQGIQWQEESIGSRWLKNRQWGQSKAQTRWCGVHGTHSYISTSVAGTRKVLV